MRMARARWIARRGRRDRTARRPGNWADQVVRRTAAAPMKPAPSPEPNWASRIQPSAGGSSSEPAESGPGCSAAGRTSCSAILGPLRFRRGVAVGPTGGGGGMDTGTASGG
jgi:hypothetical protein